MDSKATIDELKALVRKFVQERDWEQFNTAKDLAMDISVEASELLELFVFKSNDEIVELFKGSKMEDIKDELADVLWGVLMFAYWHNIDLSEALQKKLEKTAKRYPIEKAKGSNKKYTEL